MAFSSNSCGEIFQPARGANDSAEDQFPDAAAGRATLQMQEWMWYECGYVYACTMPLLSCAPVKVDGFTFVRDAIDQHRPLIEPITLSFVENRILGFRLGEHRNCLVMPMAPSYEGAGRRSAYGRDFG